MVKRALTLLTSILIALPLLMPFNIYGATWGDAPIIGLNISMINIDNERVASGFTVNLDTDQTRWQCVSSHSSMGCQTWVSQTTSDTVTSALDGSITANNQNFNSILYEYEFVFDKSYVGWIQTDFSSTTTGYTPKVIYVNGNTAKFTSNTVYTQFSVTNYSLTYAPLETITNLRQWNIPFESYEPNIYMMKNGFEIKDIKDYNYYQIPIYQIKHNDILFEFYSAVGYTFQFIYFIDANSSLSIIESFYQLDDGTINNFKLLDRFYDGSQYWSVYYFEISNFTKNGINKITYTNYNHLLSPILSSYKSNNYSTDFALRYGLSNQLLDDLHLIANGTTASQSAADSSQSANEQLQTDSNTLFQQENGFKSDMQNAMQNVNNTFRLQDMGTKFVSSAQWVRSQYESLTNNTPFASLITFSLITGLALILLGKVYK